MHHQKNKRKKKWNDHEKEKRKNWNDQKKKKKKNQIAKKKENKNFNRIARIVLKIINQQNIEMKSTLCFFVNRN